MKCFQNGYVMSFDNHIAGNGQPGRSRTDHCNLFSGGFGFGRQLTGTIVSFPVGCKAFQIANGHRITLFGKDAKAFTLNLLGTNPSANSGKTVFLPDMPDGPGKITVFNQLDKTRYVNFYRTARHAVGLFALQAPFGFQLGHFRCVTGGHFQKIS